MRHQQPIREALVSRDTPISVRIVAAIAVFAVSSTLTGGILGIAGRHGEATRVAKGSTVTAPRTVVRQDGSTGDASGARGSGRV